MIKEFCDFCGEEITVKNKFDPTADLRFSPRPHVNPNASIWISVSFADATHVCKFCFIDTVNRLDTRLRKGEPESVNL